MKSQSHLTLSFFLFCSILVALTCWAMPLSAHGIQVSVSQEQPQIFIKVSYHGSKIAANAGVAVFFKTGETETEFLKGNTDQNGLYSFLPDKPGRWNITVDDMMGHRKQVSIDLGNDFFPVVSEKEVAKVEIPVTQEKQQQVDAVAKNTGNSGNATVTNEPETTAKHAFTSNSSWYYLIKIVLGVLLILAITLYLSRWQKKQESQKNNEK